MRDPAYRNGSTAIGPDGRIIERSDLPGEPTPLLRAAPERAVTALSPILWECRGAEIMWGGASTGDQDHLSPVPEWTITEPGWHPRSPGRPREPLVRPDPPDHSGVAPWRLS